MERKNETTLWVTNGKGSSPEVRGQDKEEEGSPLTDLPVTFINLLLHT